VVERVGRFNETLHANEDWEYWIRCAAAGIGFQYLPSGRDMLALVRLHSDSASTDVLKMKRGEFEMRLLVAPRLSLSARLLNCRRGLVASFALGPQGRTRRLWRLAWATGNARGALLVAVEWLFGEGAPGYPLGRWLARNVPWPVQRAVLRLIT